MRVCASGEEKGIIKRSEAVHRGAAGGGTGRGSKLSRETVTPRPAVDREGRPGLQQGKARARVKNMTLVRNRHGSSGSGLGARANWCRGNILGETRENMSSILF